MEKLTIYIWCAIVGAISISYTLCLTVFYESINSMYLVDGLPNLVALGILSGFISYGILHWFLEGE